MPIIDLDDLSLLDCYGVGGPDKVLTRSDLSERERVALDFFQRTVCETGRVPLMQDTLTAVHAVDQLNEIARAVLSGRPP